MTSREPDFFAKLTQRQREVLTFLAQRLSHSKLEQFLQKAEAATKLDLTALRTRFRNWLRPAGSPFPTERQEDPPANPNAKARGPRRS